MDVGPFASGRPLRHQPASGGNKASKLKAIRDALRNAKRVWLATDCDREGQLIGQEILEHYDYRGVVMRVIFTAQDPQTIRDAFARARPNAAGGRLYAAAVARRQADQIYNLSLTRTATVTLGRGTRSVIGVGRVKTPTLAIVCKRELEIRNFVPQAYFEVIATAQVAADSSGCGTRRKSASSNAVRPRRLPPPLRVLRDRSWCGSRTSDKGRRGCMICHRYSSSAGLASAGRRRGRWR